MFMNVLLTIRANFQLSYNLFDYYKYECNNIKTDNTGYPAFSWDVATRTTKLHIYGMKINNMTEGPKTH